MVYLLSDFCTHLSNEWLLCAYMAWTGMEVLEEISSSKAMNVDLSAYSMKLQQISTRIGRLSEMIKNIDRTLERIE